LTNGSLFFINGKKREVNNKNDPFIVVLVIGSKRWLSLAVIAG